MGAVLDEMERSLFPLLKTKRTDMPVIPEGAELDPEHQLDPWRRAGSWPRLHRPAAPCVADRCRIVIDRRFLIEEDPGRRSRARSPPCWRVSAPSGRILV